MTSEGFAMIEVEWEASIDPHSAEGKAALDALGPCLGVGDIAHAFHSFKISREFSSYLGLMELTAREAGVIGQDFGWGPVEADEVLVPCFTSLPMVLLGHSILVRQQPTFRSCNQAACLSHAWPMTALSLWSFGYARREQWKLTTVPIRCMWKTLASLL